MSYTISDGPDQTVCVLSWSLLLAFTLLMSVRNGEVCTANYKCHGSFKHADLGFYCMDS